MNKKRLLNKSEQRVYDELINNDSISASNVFSKVRIADVVELSKSGIRDELYTYALKAHFDFVVCDKNLIPEFAVEFNGPSHCSPEQKYKDDLKIEICKLSHLPILQINDRYLERTYRGKMTLFSWILDVYYTQIAFDKAQEEGLVPYDEPFDPLFIISQGLDGSARWPYQIGLDARLRFQSLQKKKILYDCTTSGILGHDNKGVIRGAEFIRVDEEKCIYTESAMRNYSFPADIMSLMTELMVATLGDEVSRYCNGQYVLMNIRTAQDKIFALHKKLALISLHSCDGLLDKIMNLRF